jgi:Protein of unknown function (DUF4231)
MEEQKFEKFFKTTYTAKLIHYRQRALYNQRRYQWLTWAIVIFSMMTAILVGLEPFFDWLIIKLLAIVLSIIVSSLTAALKTFNFQEKWAFYNKICNELENEYDLYQANAEGYASTDDKERYFVVRVWALINQTTTLMKNATVSPASSSVQQ